MRLSPIEVDQLRQDYFTLLDQELPEQRYQDFLEKNTPLVPREFVQNHGVHFDLVIRKLFLAQDYCPDLFYLAKSSQDWNLVLVELEKPQSRYFKDSSNNLHPDFLRGMDQIARWKAWFDNPSNRASFVDGTLSQIRVPEAMRRNPCFVKYVLVHGRRAEFESSEIRRGLIRARESDDVRIISYDSLAEALHTKSQLYVGVRKNEHLDLVSKTFVGETIFSWVDPTYLRITDEIRADAISNKPHWFHRSPQGGFVLDHVLSKLGRCIA